MDKALTSHQLAEKAGIELEQARRIFQAARDVAALRLVGSEWDAVWRIRAEALPSLRAQV